MRKHYYFKIILKRVVIIMNHEKYQDSLEKYALLAVKSGLNLQKGQLLVINCPTHSAYFAKIAAKCGFELGAKDVIVVWGNEEIARVRYDNADISRYEAVPAWQAKLLNDAAEEGAAFLHVASADPDIFTGIDSKKTMAWARAMQRDCKPYRDKLDIDACPWCIMALPNENWAKKVFPDCDTDTAMEKLWEAILKASRVDTPDPIAAWDSHRKSFGERKDKLNALKLTSLRLQTGRGTDITIGLTNDHVWEGGGAYTADGLYFFPNIPTEEIFTTPHRMKADGKVVNALPLIYQGTRIDGFSLTFKDGAVTDFSAEVGYDVLKSLLDTDAGARHLGEVALVPHKSPISDMGILFYNTLFDENASCHLAIGQGFPNCLKGGASMTREQLNEAGINESATHCDFMIGTADMTITGTTADGKTVELFKNGNWA